MMPKRVLLGVWLLAAVGACSRPTVVPVGRPEAPHPRVAGKTFAALTRLLNRRKARGKLYLSATLWTRAYAEAFVRKLARQKAWSAAQASRALSDLVDRFIRGRTAFRVQLEALDRPLTLQGKDPVLDLAQWRWELWTSRGDRFPARKVTVDTKQLFRAGESGYSWRIQGTVEFPFPLAPPKVNWVELEAVPPTGRAAFRLRWRIGH